MAAATPAPDLASRRTALSQAARNGANWFYWIAGLSLLNSLVALFAGEWNFIFGVGITQVIDAVAQGLAAEAGGGAWALKVGGLFFSVGALSTYVLFGWLAHRGKTAGFVIGVVFYALDGLIFLAAGDLIGAGFHVVALFLMGRGLKAHRDLQHLPADAPEPTDEKQRIAAAVEAIAQAEDQYETIP